MPSNKLSISIEPKFAHLNGLFSRLHLEKDQIVQGDVFRLGFKITNTCALPISSFVIRNIQIRSASGQQIFHTFPHEFTIPDLNPHEEKTIWISNFGTDMYGLVVLSLRLQTSGGLVIEAVQVNRFNSEESGHFANEWLDSIYIKSSHEYVQERTNKYLLWLAFATALVAISPFVGIYFEERQSRVNIAICKEEGMTGVVTDTRTGISISCEEYFDRLSFSQYKSE